MQIPDDLSPPDESDALRLPPLAVASGPIVAGACLEAPPPFSGELRPAGAPAEEPSRRQARREARRQARGETSATPSEAAPAEAAPAEREPAPAGDDERVIDN